MSCSCSCRPLSPAAPNGMGSPASAGVPGARAAAARAAPCRRTRRMGDWASSGATGLRAAAAHVGAVTGGAEWEARLRPERLERAVVAGAGRCRRTRRMEARLRPERRECNCSCWYRPLSPDAPNGKPIFVWSAGCVSCSCSCRPLSPDAPKGESGFVQSA